MKILVLGGTRFVGRHFVNAALARDHEVTLFHRGKTNPGLFPGVEEIYGDRLKDIEKLVGEWDVAVDTCGYFPRAVQISADHLRDRVEQYMFISTVAVYRDFSKKGLDETDYLKTLEDPTVEEVNESTYGPLKTECEGVVTGIFPKRSFIVRPGRIAGPYDPTDRFTYWVHRIGVGGEVLAPNGASEAIQLIDAADLAQWLVSCIESRECGIYNAAGPTLSFEAMLQACRRATDSDATFTWVSKDFMHQIEIDTEAKMPLWNPDATGRTAGYYAVDSSRAEKKGLRYRSMEETARATWKWIEEHVEDHDWRVGLDLLEEREMLSLWKQKKGKS